MPPLVSEYAAVPYEVASNIYGALLQSYMNQQQQHQSQANEGLVSGSHRGLSQDSATLQWPREVYFPNPKVKYELDKTYHTIDLAALVRKSVGVPQSMVTTNTNQSQMSMQGPAISQEDPYANLKSQLEGIH